MTEEFKIKGDHIELVKLLKVTGLTSTGGEAKMIIEDGLVIVNDQPESRKRRKLVKGDCVQFEETTINLI